MKMKIQNEEKFHDDWAKKENITSIDYKLVNEVVTSPELRYIHKYTGDIKDKLVLDVGCGLGEVSVYFASKGAKVISTDLSSEMCSFSSKLAEKNGLKIQTIVSNAENFEFLDAFPKFDVIYCGNVLHHVNLYQVVDMLYDHLADGGTFVSWDPLAYNPIINVYRKLASNVRTEDERPLKIGQLKYMKSKFRESKTEYFWLTTQIIFIFMFFLEFKNPSKVRYWKDVVYNHKKWSKIFIFFNSIDNIIKRLLPPVKLFSWNVVFIGKK